MLTYALLTPTRDESSSLPRLAASLFAQTRRPLAWLIIDNGSTDGTGAVAASLARSRPWIHVRHTNGEPVRRRGGPVVRALQIGFEMLDPIPDVVVKVDADVSLPPDHFERLIAEFERDPRLGIASGSRSELDRGRWRQKHLTGTSVEGQCRAWRWSCLRDIGPLEERLGWDGLDEFKANTRGWRTRAFSELTFRHHRTIGERDASPAAAWRAQGDATHYMGYRPSYALLRALRHAPREPAAFALAWGYLAAAATRKPRCPDPSVRAYVRREQALRRLPRRALESVRGR